MTMVALKTEPSVYTIGHYDPSGAWQPIMDCASATEAMEVLAGTSRILEELNRMATAIELIETRT